MTKFDMKTKRVLVAPLDWGLGHATRCIPIIRLLLQKSCEVEIASSGSALKLLQLEFPNLKYLELPSYGASYSSRLPFMVKVFMQLPKFLMAIHNERYALVKIVKSTDYALIIADNRYGCHVSQVKSVFIGHQLNIIMPSYLKWMAPVVNYFNRKWIANFDECWIPDEEKARWTGALTQTSIKGAKYIGLLSRFVKRNTNNTAYQLAIILSGPEPQRTILEQKLMHQLKHIDINTIIVRGVVEGSQADGRIQHVERVNYLLSEELESVIVNSEIVLCRSGYSSVMDLATLGKKAIFIPTPGQTEQEYLAMLLKQRGIAYCQSQKDFDLALALKEINNYTGFAGWKGKTNLLDEAIEHALS